MCTCLSRTCNYCSPSFCAWCLNACARAIVLFKCVCMPLQLLLMLLSLLLARHTINISCILPTVNPFLHMLYHHTHIENQTKLTPYSTWALAQAYMQAACMRILSHSASSSIPSPYYTSIRIPSPRWAPASAHVQPTRTQLFA